MPSFFFFTVFDVMLQILCNGSCHLLINYCKNLIPLSRNQKNAETIWVSPNGKSLTQNLKTEEKPPRF